MSGSTAIGMVSESLQRLLAGEMSIMPAVDVTLLAPDETDTQRRLNLFLYKIQENPHLRNQDWQLVPGTADQLMPPPLSLNLYYVMTAYAVNDPQTQNSTAHAILGDAMRVFHEFAIVPEAYLVNGLLDAREQIKIVLLSFDPDEMSRVWTTFSEPYRPSVLYEISTVQIDVSAAQQAAMAPRARSIGVPRVNAPYRPPVVERMTPASGPAGTTITFEGQHLAGWQAYVRLLRSTILDGEALDSDSFTMTLPPDAVPGFYEIRIDISHLHRRVFFFEVTA